VKLLISRNIGGIGIAMIRELFDYIMGWTKKKTEITESINAIDKKIDDFASQVEQKNKKFYDSVNKRVDEVLQGKESEIENLEEEVENLHKSLSRRDKAVLSHIPYIEQLTLDHWDIILSCYKEGCKGDFNYLIDILNHKSNFFEGEYGATEIARKIRSAEEIRDYQQEHDIQVVTYLLARVEKFKTMYSKYPASSARRKKDTGEGQGL